MKLTMLGTGHAYVTECYNSCFVLEDSGRCLLVDGGGGSGLLRQLKHAGYRWMDMSEIFVSHKHLDHVLGVIWMIRLLCDGMHSGSFEGEVFLYAHRDLLSLLRSISEGLLNPWESCFLGNKLHLVPIEDNISMELLGRRTVPFDIGSGKTRQYGFSMEIGAGEKLCFCGDEPLSERGRGYARSSKWLMHEAFCLASEADVFHPYEIYHSTVKNACEEAEMLGVKNLLLFHTEDSDLKHRKERYREEGSRYFHGNLYIPDDLESFEL